MKSTATKTAAITTTTHWSSKQRMLLGGYLLSWFRVTERRWHDLGTWFDASSHHHQLFHRLNDFKLSQAITQLAICTRKSSRCSQWLSEKTRSGTLQGTACDFPWAVPGQRPHILHTLSRYFEVQTWCKMHKEHSQVPRLQITAVGWLSLDHHPHVRHQPCVKLFGRINGIMDSKNSKAW